MKKWHARRVPQLPPFLSLACTCPLRGRSLRRCLAVNTPLRLTGRQKSYELTGKQGRGAAREHLRTSDDDVALSCSSSHLAVASGDQPWISTGSAWAVRLRRSCAVCHPEEWFPTRGFTNRRRQVGCSTKIYRWKFARLSSITSSLWHKRMRMWQWRRRQWRFINMIS